jgi:murein DD-endopeptidase MepM/ murein hydrolase activator NlpD
LYPFQLSPTGRFHWRWCVLVAVFLLALTCAPVAQAAPPLHCAVPPTMGVPTWLLASMQSVSLCDLVAGASPQVPAGEHVVAAGETLSAIAQRYNTTTAVLAELNGIRDPGLLAIGTRLRLPGPGAESAPTQTTNPGIQLASACGEGLSAHPLDIPAEPARLEILGDRLYMLAGGQLYGLPLSQITDGAALLTPESLSSPTTEVGGIMLQELMDLTADSTTGELVILNKVGDLLAYRPESASWSVRMVAASLPGYWIDPQYLAITQIGASTYALDQDNASVWRLAPGASQPVVQRSGGYIAGASDLAAWGERLVLARRDGTLTDGGGAAHLAGLEKLSWASDVNATSDGLLAVDGDGRRVVLEGPEGTVDVRLRAAGMQRLRTATASGGVIYAVGGTVLYRVTSLQPEASCPAVPWDDRWMFNGVDLNNDVPALTLPFAGGILPSRPRSYPGARRMYRYGIHEGVDFYDGDAPGLAYGSAVAVIAPGTVVRIDSDFAEIPPADYEPMMREIAQMHRTPEEYLDRLRGQQVWVEHAPGVVSRYSHLSAVASDLQVGDHVETGHVIGRVGNSGTSDGVYRTTAGYHLHWEIWVGSRYLGQGLTIPETMRIYRQLF